MLCACSGKHLIISKWKEIKRNLRTWQNVNKWLRLRKKRTGVLFKWRMHVVFELVRDFLTDPWDGWIWRGTSSNSIQCFVVAYQDQRSGSLLEMAAVQQRLWRAGWQRLQIKACPRETYSILGSKKCCSSPEGCSHNVRLVEGYPGHFSPSQE